MTTTAATMNYNTIDSDIREKAVRPILKMLEMSK